RRAHRSTGRWRSTCFGSTAGASRRSRRSCPPSCFRRSASRRRSERSASPNTAAMSFSRAVDVRANSEIREQGDPMRTLAVNTFMSLDGVMQAPGGPDEDPTGGFTLGGWAVNYFDDQMMGQMADAAPYELLLGRGTYEIFAAHWPCDEGPIADHLNSTRKHVASTSLERLEWNNSTLITGDVADTSRSSSARTAPRSRSTGAPASSRRCSSTTSSTSSAC